VPTGSALWQLVTSPSETAQRLASTPQPLTFLLATSSTMVAAQLALLSTAVGQQALVDQWVQRTESFGGAVDDRLYAKFEWLGRHAPLYGVTIAILLGIVLPLTVAALIRLLGPRRASWSGAITLAAYANVALVVRDVVAVPVGLVRESLASPLTLGTLLPMSDAASPLAMFLWTVDVFVLWWLVLVALGAAALTGQRPQALVTVFSVAYLGVGLGLTLAMFTGGSA